jgi:hypothetical protein
VARPATGAYGVRVDLTPGGTDEATDTTEYLAFVRRILAALERRVATADLDALASMVELRADLDRHIEGAVRKLRHDEVAAASWAQIGQAFGITRQAAQERFAHVGGARRRGGQPGNLR